MRNNNPMAGEPDDGEGQETPGKAKKAGFKGLVKSVMGNKKNKPRTSTTADLRGDLAALKSGAAAQSEVIGGGPRTSTAWMQEDVSSSQVVGNTIEEDKEGENDGAADGSGRKGRTKGMSSPKSKQAINLKDIDNKEQW